MDPNDPSDPEELIEHLLSGVTSAHRLMADYLRKLPLPIGIPDMDGEWSAAVGLMAIERARVELLQGEPIDDLLAAIYRRLILDWLTAYELMALVTHAGPAPWRCDGIERRIEDMLVAADLIDQMIEPESEG